MRELLTTLTLNCRRLIKRLTFLAAFINAVIASVALLAYSPSAYADATSIINQVSVRADIACLAPAPTLNCITATTPSATVSMDSATTSWLVVSRASAGGTFGANQGSIDLLQEAIFPATPIWDLGFTYSLDVLAPGGTWTSLVQTSVNASGTSMSAPINTTLTGHFDFSSGVGYQFRSSLMVSGTKTGGIWQDASAFSEWTDVLMFTGGSGAGADFVVGLNGLLFAENYFLPLGTSGKGCSPGLPCDSVFVAPTDVYHSRIDFASALGFSVEDGVQIQSLSGTQYPTSVPEPATAVSLLAGLCGLISMRRWIRR